MPTSSNRLLQVRLLSSIAKRPLPGATMALAVSASSCLFIGPLPVGSVFSIDAELVGMVLTSDLLVERGLANTGGDAFRRYHWYTLVGHHRNRQWRSQRASNLCPRRPDNG